MRTVYLGTSPFAVAVLERLAASAHRPVLVVTRPDRPRGRGRRLAAPPVADAARALGIDVLQPESVNSDEARAAIAAVSPEAVAICAFGAYIREPLLSEHPMWNVHPSLLPRWRGAAPVERAILAGDAETGVTIHRTVEALDAGPVAAQETFAIGDEDDAGSVFARSAEVAARLIGEVLPDPEFAPQPEEGATYADKIGPDDRVLDLAESVDAFRRVRALSPHIGAWTTLAGRRVTVWKARLEAGELVPLVVQPEGKRSMSYDEFLRGLR
jgi:methionyl-tRNA formyltransferase